MLKACEKRAGSTVDTDSLGLARKRLVVASSLLSCAVLIVALIAAWGFSVDTSYKSDATLLYDTILSERPDPAALQGGHATPAEALAAYEWSETDEFVPMSFVRDLREWDGLTGFHDAFVVLYAPDDTLTIARRPSRVATGEDSDFTDAEAVELIELAHGAFEAAPPCLWWDRLVVVDGRTFLWDTVVTCVNPAYDPETGKNNETSWYASGDLQDYVADGYLAGRYLGLLDVTSSVVALKGLAATLALLGAAGCIALLFICRAMINLVLAQHTSI